MQSARCNGRHVLLLVVMGGCAPEPVPTVGTPTLLAAGGSKTCVVIDETKLRCWGNNNNGGLGLGLPNHYYGAEEPARDVPFLEFGSPITNLDLATSASCLTTHDGDTRCWGGGTVGSLGVLWDGWLGDDESVLDAPIIRESKFVQIAAGSSHACGLLANATMKCWGWGAEGATGYGTSETLCDEPGEEPIDLPPVDVGGPVVAISAGGRNTCAILETGSVKCWGHGGSGKLGLGFDAGSIGTADGGVPAAYEPIQLAGGPVVQVAVQGRQICARHQAGTVSCWGETGPWLGYGKAMDDVGFALGDDEHPAVLGTVDVGGPVAEIVVGDAFTCARLEDGSVKCWGASNLGQLGYGNTDYVGYEETPAEVGPVDLGGVAISLVAGWDHACAILADQSIRCWGQGGMLGYGLGPSLGHVGDDETPAETGPVPFW